MTKTTAAFALCAVTSSLAACSTTDATPPGSVAALIDAEESDEEQGIEVLDSSDEGVATSEGAEGESAEATAAEGESDDGGAELEPDAAASTTGGPTDQAAGAAGMPDPADMSDASCTAFFEGVAPLAARATDARELLAVGAESSLSALDYAEIGVIVGRVDAIGAEASERQTAVLERINAPFIELVQAAQAGGADAETGEVTYDPIDAADSEAAQEEFTSECVGAEASE